MDVGNFLCFFISKKQKKPKKKTAQCVNIFIRKKKAYKKHAVRNSMIFQALYTQNIVHNFRLSDHGQRHIQIRVKNNPLRSVSILKEIKKWHFENLHEKKVFDKKVS